MTRFTTLGLLALLFLVAGSFVGCLIPPQQLTSEYRPWPLVLGSGDPCFKSPKGPEIKRIGWRCPDRRETYKATTCFLKRMSAPEDALKGTTVTFVPWMFWIHLEKFVGLQLGDMAIVSWKGDSKDTYAHELAHLLLKKAGKDPGQLHLGEEDDCEGDACVLYPAATNLAACTAQIPEDNPYRVAFATMRPSDFRHPPILMTTDTDFDDPPTDEELEEDDHAPQD